MVKGAGKTRTLVILIGLVLLVGIVIIAYQLTRPDALEKASFSTASVPKNIQNVPGEKTSERYKNLQLEENKLTAQQAKKAGVSAIPTLTEGEKFQPPPAVATETGCRPCCTNCGSATTDIQAVLDLAQTDPEAFKRMLLENPALAARLARENPELFKKLMRGDPKFAAAFAAANPSALKDLLKNDPAFARTFGKQNPNDLKNLILGDPHFAEDMGSSNGDLMRRLLQEDPTFDKRLGKNNDALLAELKREGVPKIDPAIAARLMGETKKNPNNALDLLKANPGLCKVLSQQDPDFALKSSTTNASISLLCLSENPDMALKLAESDPDLFKKLMLANPALATKLAQVHPELFKKLMMTDPAFAKALASVAPELVKELMTEDPALANWMAQNNPDFVKQVLLLDSKFAATMLAQNPEAIEGLMNDDPAFAQRLAEVNPGLVKALFLLYPEFAQEMSRRNARAFKSLLAGDPIFTRNLANKNPELLKSLFKSDSDFARLMANRNPDLLRSLMEGDPQFGRDLLSTTPNLTIAGAPRTVTPAPAPTANQTYEKNRQAQLAQEQQKQLEDAYKKGVDDIVANMTAEIGNATKIWTEGSTLSLVQGDWANPKKEEAKGGSEGLGSSLGNASQGATSPTLITAGTVLFAVIDTAVSTDEPGPILATITNGRFTGAKLIGELQSTGPRAEKITINFSTMIPKGAEHSMAIKAVAVDPDTSRTGIATSVDHHYLERYGMLLASSFMTGYSKVITQEGTVSTTAANAGSTTTVSPQLSGKKEIYAALGDVGKALGTSAAENVNRANTITVNSGTGIGLLFLSDVSEPT